MVSVPRTEIIYGCLFIQPRIAWCKQTWIFLTVPRSLGVSVSVTIEGTSAVYKLPIAPLITGSHPVDNKGWVHMLSLSRIKEIILMNHFLKNEKILIFDVVKSNFSIFNF